MRPSDLREVVQEPLVSKGLKESRAELLQRVQALKKVKCFPQVIREVVFPLGLYSMVNGCCKINKCDNHKSQRISLILFACYRTTACRI